jgi:polyisoprenoid-binding protein YceI
MVLKINYLFLLLVSPAAFAVDKTLTLDPANSPVVFNAVGRPSMIKIKGKDANATGSLTIHDGKASGTIQTDLTQFHTGIDMRDHHMKEKYLETDKPGFQNAVLTIDKLEIPAADGDKKDVPLHGTLSLHGVKKDVTGKTDLTVAGQSVSGVAHIPIKISEYAITLPTFAGATMAEDVDVEVHFQGKIN